MSIKIVILIIAAIAIYLYQSDKIDNNKKK